MESLEIEFKTLIEKETFNQLIQFYHLEEKEAYWQKNTYFDTSNETLKQQKMALRIREFEKDAQQTLKIPFESGKLEITDSIPKECLLELYQKQRIYTPSTVEKKLASLSICASDLKITGSLETYRYDLPLPIGLLSIDHSFYYGVEDYELELEVKDFTIGKKAFNALLTQHHIPYKKAPSKISRMFKGKNKK